MNKNQFDKELQNLLNDIDEIICDNLDKEVVENILNEEIDNEVEQKLIKSNSFIVSNPNIAKQMMENPTLNRANSNSCINEIEDLLHQSFDQKMNDKSRLDKDSQQKGPLFSSIQIQTLPDFSEYGYPTVIATSTAYLALGLKEARILIIKQGTWEIQSEIQIQELLGNNIVSIDISNHIVAAGFSNGHVVVINGETGHKIKLIRGVHTSLVTSIRIIDILTQNVQKICVLSCDISGNCYMTIVRRALLWSYVYDRLRVIPKIQGPLYEIAVLKEKDSNLKNQVIISVSSNDQIITFSLYPSIKILFIFNRPNFVQKGIQPSISWGFSSINNKMSPVLSISWAQLIQIISIQDFGKEEYTSFYFQQPHIIFCKFIDNDQLILYDDTKAFKLAYIPLFSKGHYPQISIKELDNGHLSMFSNAQKSIQQMITQVKIQSQQNSDLFQDDYIPQKITLWNNTAIDLIQSIIIYYDSNENELKTISTLNQLKYILYMIKNITDDNIHSWFQVLSTVIQIFQTSKKGQSQFDNDKSQLGKISKELVVTFVQLQGQRLSLNINEIPEVEINLLWDETLTIAFQFCIECELQDFMFIELKDLIVSLIGQEPFFEALIIFIKQKLIINVSQNTFRDICNHFLIKKNFEILNQFILSQDLESIDIGFTYTICLENNIFLPLFFICPKLNNDFITPLNKVFIYWRDEAQDQVTFKYKNIIKSLLEKCLNFIELSWRKILFPKSVLTTEQLEQAINQQVIWLLTEEVLNVFLQEQTEKLLSVIQLLFQENCTKILDKKPQELIYYFTKDHQVIDIDEQTNIIGQYYLQTQIVLKVFKVFQLGDLTKKKKKQVYNFIVNNISYEQIQPDFHLLIEAIKFYTSLRYKKKHIIYILICSHYLKERKDVETLIKSDNPLSIFVDAYFKYKESNFSSCFELLFQLGERERDRNIFIFLNYVIDKTPQKEFIVQLISLFAKLIVESPEDAYLLCKKLGEQYYEEIVNSEEINQKQKFLFLKFLFQERSSWQPSKQTLIKYMNLLCVFESNEVLNELKSYTYPLNELKDLFQQKKNYEALAYVLQSFGKYEEALNLYVFPFVNEAERTICNSYKGQKQTFERMEQLFYQIIDLCKIASSSDEQHTNLYVQFGKMLFSRDMLRSHWSYLQYSNQNNLTAMRILIVKLNKLFCELFFIISKCHSIQSLIEIIEENPDIFNMIQLRQSFTTVLENFGWESILLRKHRSIFLEDYLTLNENLLLECSKFCFDDKDLTRYLSKIDQEERQVDQDSSDSSTIYQGKKNRFFFKQNIKELRSQQLLEFPQNGLIQEEMNESFQAEDLKYCLQEMESKYKRKLSNLKGTSLESILQDENKDNQENQNRSQMDMFNEFPDSSMQEQRTLNKMQAFDRFVNNYQSQLDEFTKQQLFF